MALRLVIGFLLAAASYVVFIVIPASHLF